MIAFGTQFPQHYPPAHEVLGMGYIPLMLTAGSLTLLATTFVISHVSACVSTVADEDVAWRIVAEVH